MNWYGHVQRINKKKKATSNNFGMVSNWKKKRRKTSKFLDAGGYNRNEREGN